MSFQKIVQIVNNFQIKTMESGIVYENNSMKNINNFIKIKENENESNTEYFFQQFKLNKFQQSIKITGVRYEFFQNEDFLENIEILIFGSSRYLNFKFIEKNLESFYFFKYLKEKFKHKMSSGQIYEILIKGKIIKDKNNFILEFDHENNFICPASSSSHFEKKSNLLIEENYHILNTNILNKIATDDQFLSKSSQLENENIEINNNEIENFSIFIDLNDSINSQFSQVLNNRQDSHNIEILAQSIEYNNPANPQKYQHQSEINLIENFQNRELELREKNKLNTKRKSKKKIKYAIGFCSIIILFLALYLGFKYV